MSAENRTSSPAASPAPSARLRIVGAWSGVLDVQLESWTVRMLRAAVAARSAAAASPDCINLICSGKVLRDGGEGASPSLLDLGVKNNAKVLATAVAADRGKEVREEADRSQKLTRLRAAALALAQRHADGSVPVEDYNMELEDQSGQTVKFESETDKKGLMMGLMLHQNAKSLINKQQYKDALDVLSMSEEAFSLCDSKITEMIDNIPMLELDIVWCYFMLRDVSCLSAAGIRLGRARKGFERAHGKDSTRFRILHEGRQAELAIYLRLELLEGVVAYYSGNFEESRKALSSAQAKYSQLQVSDEALSIVMNMGYKQQAAKRALRMSGQDIQSAVDFLVEERARKMRRYEENIQRQNEIMEQKKYGKTPQNKAVDIQKLNELASIGFERILSAEALRVNENDFQTALDDLTNPEKNHILQNRIDSRNKARALRPTLADIEEFVSMGYERTKVMDAVRTSRTKDEALAKLLATASTDESQQAAINPTQGQASDPVSQDQVAQDQEGPSVPATTDSHMDERDEEMEDELAKKLTGDALADYDIEVAREAEAIAEYMVLLDSVEKEYKGSR